MDLGDAVGRDALERTGTWRARRRSSAPSPGCRNSPAACARAWRSRRAWPARRPVRRARWRALVSSSWRRFASARSACLFLALLVEARIFRRGLSRPASSSRPGPTCRRRRCCSAGPACCHHCAASGDQRRWRAGRLATARVRIVSGLARLFVDELDPLLLVLLQHRAQLGRHGIPGRPCPRRSRIRGPRPSSAEASASSSAASSAASSSSPPPSVGRRSSPSPSSADAVSSASSSADFAEIGHQRHGLGDVHRLGARCPVLAVQIA